MSHPLVPTGAHTDLPTRPLRPVFPRTHKAHRPHPLTISGPHSWLGLAAIGLWLFMAVPTAVAYQIENPVYVDDSPQAWELFRQAQDQTRHNAGEAVRLYQELLDEYTFKLIPAGNASTDEFKSVRSRVLEALLLDQTEGGLLERYRLIQTPAAQQLLDAGDLDRAATTRSLTDPGLEAMLRLAQRSLEHGRFSTARYWLSQARHHPTHTGEWPANGGAVEQQRRTMHWWLMWGITSHMLGLEADAAVALKQLGDETYGTDGKLARTALEAIIQRPVTPRDEQNQRAAAPDEGAALEDLVAEAIWTFPLEDSLASRRRAARAAEQGDFPLNAPDNGREGRPANRERLGGSGAAGLRLSESDLATATAAVNDQTIYINEGHTVRAIHRLTGRQIWQFSNVNRLTLSERDVTASLDMNHVAVVDGPNGCIVTLTGHAQPNNRSDAGRVICLDAETGSPRWSVNLASPPLIDAPSNEQLFPHGAPVVSEGVVYVSARRVSMQAITSAYIVAIDLDSGAVRWVRNIASSGGLRAGIRPFDSLVYDDSSRRHGNQAPAAPNDSGVVGALFVSTAVGAIARLEPVTGEIVWLSRYSAPINVGIADYIRRPWEIAGPVVTPRGVLAIQPDQRRILLLDPDTGALLESHDSSTSSGWNQPRYLLADDERVYAVGAEIRAFDLEVLELPAWQLPGETRAQSSVIPPQSPVGEPIPSDPSPSAFDRTAVDIRGRVQLTNGSLIVPTTEAMLMIDGRSGHIKNSLALDSVGNPLALPSQLILAGSDRLDSYMSFATAQRMLRERIAQQPGDPEPAISLLRLAMRVRNLNLSLEAAEMALAALNSPTAAAASQPTPAARATNTRDELVSLLLELVSTAVISTTAEGESVFALVNTAAVDRPQRIEYLLAYGDWLTRHAVDRAVESWQQILSDPLLAQTWRRDPDNSTGERPSAAWAADRLHALIQRRGINVYSPQADFASLRLRQLSSSAPAGGSTEIDPARLVAAAHEFPFSAAAAEAATLAANSYSRRGEHRAGAAVLLHVYRHTTHTETAIKLVGSLVNLCHEAGWSTQAESIVRHALATYGDHAMPSQAGALPPVLMSEWLVQHAANRPRGTIDRELPVVGVVATSAKAIGGSIVEPFALRTTGGELATVGSLGYPADRVLLHHDQTLQLMQPHAAEPLWTLNDQPDRPQLLRMTPREILLWIAADPKDPRAIMLNADDGVVRWTTPRLQDLLGDVVDELSRTRGVRDHMPDGEPFDPQQTLPVLGDDLLYLVQRTGGIAAIDLADGKTIRWTLAARGGDDSVPSLEQVYSVALHDGALVLSGMGREGGAGSALTPRVLVLDPHTGRAPTVDNQPQGTRWFAGANPSSGSNDALVKWLRFSPLGELLIGTVDGVTCIDVFTGQPLWRRTGPAAADSQLAWMLNRQLLLEDQRGRLRIVNVRDGSVGDAFETPLRGEWDSSELRHVFLVRAPHAAGVAGGADGSGDRIIAHYPQRVVMYDPANGAIVGVDVISDDRDFRWLLFAASGDAPHDAPSRLVLVNSRVQQAPMADQPGRRAQQWVYRLYVLSENGKVLADPVELNPLNERVQFAMLMNQMLLLSTNTETLLIPLVDHDE